MTQDTNTASGAADLTDVQYLEQIADQYGDSQVPEIRAHTKRMKSIAARLASAPAQPVVPHMSASEVNALPTAAREYIHQLATNADPAGMVRENMQLRDINAGLQAMYRKAADALETVTGCFRAAEVEGLQDALADTADERLKDLVERRLMYALYAAQDAAAPAQPVAEPAEVSAVESNTAGAVLPAGTYFAKSVDGKQHNTGKVCIKREPGHPGGWNYFATTASPEDAQAIADAMNARTSRGQAPAGAVDETWCAYVAGMICTYLKEDAEGAKAQAIAGIIARRLMFLQRPVPQPDAGVLEDAARLDWLEEVINTDGAIHLHDGQNAYGLGLGLRPGHMARTLREAIDAARAQQKGQSHE